MNALRKKVVQASVTVGSMNSAESCLSQSSAQNPRVARCNAQTVAKNTSTNLPTSGKPIASEAPSEAEAIQRAQNGDQTMFEYLYRLHSPRVYAMCLRMVRDVARAEDLTQEASLLLFRKIHTFRGESAFPTWLYRLTVNLVLMHLPKGPYKRFRSMRLQLPR
jgi:Sigma-70 region 2